MIVWILVRCVVVVLLLSSDANLQSEGRSFHCCCLQNLRPNADEERTHAFVPPLLLFFFCRFFFFFVTLMKVEAGFVQSSLTDT